MNNGKYIEAILAFEALVGYRDSSEKLIEVKDILYDEALSLMNSGKYTEAIAAFEELNGYKSCEELITESTYYLNLKYTLNGNTYIISGFDSNATDRSIVKIPSIYNDKHVTSIGDSAFSNYKSLTSITIPDSVTSIANYAFYGCSSLTSIIIPDSVTSIGDFAFINCKKLTSIMIPDSVTSIANYAFYGCSSLTSIIIPDSVTSIANYAFYECSSLETVYFTGTEEEWSKINIRSSNGYLKNANIIYNYVPEE